MKKAPALKFIFSRQEPESNISTQSENYITPVTSTVDNITQAYDSK